MTKTSKKHTQIYRLNNRFLTLYKAQKGGLVTVGTTRHFGVITVANTLFGLKRIEAARYIHFGFFVWAAASREALQASNEKRHDEAEERKEQQRQAAIARGDGQADSEDTPATAITSEPKTSRHQQQEKQLKPIPRKRRILFIALVDNNFGIGNLFLTLDLAEEVISKAERKLQIFLDALEAYYATLGIELKWVCTREFGKRRTKRKHFHLIINGTRWTVDVRKIQNFWKYGKAKPWK